MDHQCSKRVLVRVRMRNRAWSVQTGAAPCRRVRAAMLTRDTNTEKWLRVECGDLSGLRMLLSFWQLFQQSFSSLAATAETQSKKIVSKKYGNGLISKMVSFKDAKPRRHVARVELTFSRFNYMMRHYAQQFMMLKHCHVDKVIPVCLLQPIS